MEEPLSDYTPAAWIHYCLALPRNRKVVGTMLYVTAERCDHCGKPPAKIQAATVIKCRTMPYPKRLLDELGD